MCIRDRLVCVLTLSALSVCFAEDSDNSGEVTAQPVSYTHLDVYKRQDNLSAAERNAIRNLIEQLEQFLKTKCEKGRLR